MQLPLKSRWKCGGDCDESPLSLRNEELIPPAAVMRLEDDPQRSAFIGDEEKFTSFHGQMYPVTGRY